MIINQKWIEHPDLIIVHGDCPKGADRFAREFAEQYGVPEERHPALWDLHGRSAGHKRNKAMVDSHPDEAIFFIRGESRGTRNCLGHARKAGIPHVIYGDRP